MKKKFVLTFMLFLLLVLVIKSQVPQTSQTLRGIVKDKTTEAPIAGALITIDITNSKLVASSNSLGEFIIENVPLGKYSITASFLGYESLTLSNILVGSGKQVWVEFAMQQSHIDLGNVVIKGNKLKNETVNSMNIISGRTFSVEETRRFAGGMDDPARMVSAFAGVSTGNIQDNAIIIRGNAPKYLSWQLEGVEIPTASHFSNINVIGGGFVTIFSNQLLSNSDFFTGAFAAEYGNALSGVFDMKLRCGNNKKHEFTVQAGVIGLDFAAEGPFVKGKNSSFLFNYRYSTMSLITFLIPSTQVPKYQDFSFKLNFPTQKIGTFSIWGIAALDKNVQPENSDSTTWKYDFNRFTYDFVQKTANLGITHKKVFGTKTFINTSIVASFNQSNIEMKRFNNNLILEDNYYGKNSESKITFKSFVNNKFSERHINRTGIIINTLFFNIENKAAINNTLPLITLNHDNGYSNRYEAFSQSQYYLTKTTLLNCGVHATYFQLNNEKIIEPRIGISQNIGNSHKITFAYGKHSNMEPLRIYFYENNENQNITKPNKNLKLTKAHHFIAAYDWFINDNLRLKIEPYYQILYDVPVIKDSAFSMINFEQDFYFDDILVNEGKGRNIGIDITFERFFNKSYYYLLTTSFFKSQYQTSDGEIYPTKYDKGFVVNILAGKEFVFERKNRNTISLNVRATISGGYKVTPINFELSEKYKTDIYNWSKPYSEQNPIDCNADFSVNWRIDKKKHTSIWSIQVKNIFANPSGYIWTYNHKIQKMDYVSEKIVVPSISYRIEF